MDIIIPLLNSKLTLRRGVTLIEVSNQSNVYIEDIDQNQLYKIKSQKNINENLYNNCKKAIIIKDLSNDVTIESQVSKIYSTIYALNISASSGYLVFLHAFAIKKIRGNSYQVKDDYELDYKKEFFHNKTVFKLFNNTNIVPLINTLYSNAIKASTHDKHVLYTLRRWNHFLSKEIVEEKIVDATMCLESLIKTQHELSFRFSLYCAYMTGESIQSRAANYSILKKTYGMRSKIVHGNDFDHSQLDETYMQSLNKLVKSSVSYHVNYMAEHNKEQWKKHLDDLVLQVDERIGI